MADIQTVVLSVASSGESGSTLLSRLLGRLPGAVAVGEVGFLWDRAVQGNIACGCGVPFHACPFWRSVGDHAFGGWHLVDVAEVTRLRNDLLMRRRHLSLPRSLPVRLWPGLSRSYASALGRYSDLLSRVYRAIASVSGADVIVDSTKGPAHLVAERAALGLDVRMVHLVRDSRGVAFSNTKWVERQWVADGMRFRGRQAPAKTALRWAWINVAYDLLAARGIPTVVVRYEDLVRDPATELARIGAHAGISLGPADLQFLRGNEADLDADHIVAGNRLRLARGSLVLRADEAWRDGLSRSQQIAVAAITLPLMRRYAAASRRGRPGP